MLQSQKVLLEFLSAFVHDTRPACDFSEVDWEKLRDLSEEHAVAGIVFDEVQRMYQECRIPTLSTQLKLDWYAQEQQIEQQNRRVDSVLELVFKTMAEAHIPAVLLKGQALAQEYRNPSVRSSGDIDLFVGRKYYDEAKHLFASFGWLDVNGIHEDIKHVGFKLEGIEIELHRYGLLVPGKKQNEYLQTLLEEALEKTECGYQLGDAFVRTLPPMENLIYTFAHMFRHFIGGGVGLRQLVDVAVLVKNTCTEEFISHSGLKLCEVLKNIDLEKAWSIFGHLNVNYLGFKEESYVDLENQYKPYAEKIIEVVLNDGNFGRVRKRAESKKRGSISSYISMLKGYMRLYDLFPRECKMYAYRQMRNTAEKYL